MKLYKVIFILFLVCCFGSCQKWFDVSPKSEMKGENLFTNEAGFRDALIGVYSLMINGNAYGGNLSMSYVDVLAQTYDNFSSNHVFRYSINYEYTESTEETRQTNIWSQLYKIIANANIILSKIDEKKSVFAGKNYNIIKGESLAIRALMHFDALRLFAPAPVTGSNKPAIPYLETYTNVASPQLTVEQVLGKIITDLTQARELLKDADPLGPNYASFDWSNFPDMLQYRNNRMNYYAVTGLLARVYLYKGDKPGALKMAKEVIESGLFWMTTQTSFGGIFQGEQVFALSIKDIKTKFADTYFPLREINNSQDNSVLTISNSLFAEVFPTATNTDYRITSWFEAGNSNCRRLTKYSYNNTNLPMIKLPEMYLIAAECETDTKTAVTAYFNAFIAGRGLPPIPETTDRATLNNEIGKEYRKEFIGEGQLFYYYKRLNVQKLPALPNAFTNSNAVYVLPLPQAEVEFGKIGI